MTLNHALGVPTLTSRIFYSRFRLVDLLVHPAYDKQPQPKTNELADNGHSALKSDTPGALRAT